MVWTTQALLGQESNHNLGFARRWVMSHVVSMKDVTLLKCMWSSCLAYLCSCRSSNLWIFYSFTAQECHQSCVEWWDYCFISTETFYVLCEMERSSKFICYLIAQILNFYLLNFNCFIILNRVCWSLYKTLLMLLCLLNW